MYHCVSEALYWLLCKADPIEPYYAPCAQNSKKKIVDHWVIYLGGALKTSRSHQLE